MDEVGQGRYTVPIGKAAELLGVSVPTLRRWTADGRIPTEVTSGGHRRYRLADIASLRHGHMGETGTNLRSPTLPNGPLAQLACVIETDGARASNLAAREIYLPGEEGWFAAHGAQLSLACWRNDVVVACRTGRYGPALASTRSMFCDAMLGGNGASIRECFQFTELFGIVVVRELGTSLEQKQASRLMNALRLAVLDVGTQPSADALQRERQILRRESPQQVEASSSATAPVRWRRETAA